MKQRLVAFRSWSVDAFLRAPTDALDVFLSILTWSWGAWFLSPVDILGAPPDLSILPAGWRFQNDRVLVGLALVTIAAWIVVAAFARRPNWRAWAMLATTWFWAALWIAVVRDGLRPAAVLTYGVVALAALWSWSRHAGIFDRFTRTRGQ